MTRSIIRIVVELDVDKASLAHYPDFPGSGDMPPETGSDIRLDRLAHDLMGEAIRVLAFEGVDPRPSRATFTIRHLDPEIIGEPF